MITGSIEIDRSAEEVFAYLDQWERHGEWQTAIIGSRLTTEGPPRVGTEVVETRMIGRRRQEIPYEIVVHDPPRRVAFAGTGGPVRPHGTVTVEPLDGGSRSRVTLELELRGHGLGKVVASLAERQAQTSVPLDQARLKAVLEAGA